MRALLFSLVPFALLPSLTGCDHAGADPAQDLPPTEAAAPQGDDTAAPIADAAPDAPLYPDRDGDGFGDEAASPEAGDALSPIGGDCDDDDYTVFPGAPETWDNGLTDNDCDGVIEAVTEISYGPALTGDDDFQAVGYALSAINDLDGDGADELGLTAPGASGGGRVYGLSEADSGAVSLVDGARSMRLMMAVGQIGSSLASGEDLDEDGVPDLLVGAIDLEETDQGCFVVSGAGWRRDVPLAISQSALSLVKGPMLSPLGAPGLASVRCTFGPDVNDDGQRDVLMSVSPRGSGDIVGNNGFVALFRSKTVQRNAVVDFDEAEWVSPVGESDDPRGAPRLSLLSDYNGDGLEEILLVGGTRSAVATVLDGDTGEVLARVSAALSDWSSDAVTAWPVGDLNGDGHPDLLRLGSTGSALSLNPVAPGPVTSDLGEVLPPAGHRLSSALNLGDRDGDGRDETLLIASPIDDETARPWVGVLFGADLHASAPLKADDLLLTLEFELGNFTPDGPAVLLRDFGGRGDRIALSDASASLNGSGSGAVVLLPVPR